MPVTVSFIARAGLLAGLAGLLMGKFWWNRGELPPYRAIQVQQQWALQPGQNLATYKITGGLGDVSIALQGGLVRAPFMGEVQRNTEDCVLFSSPEVPAYLFRLCGLLQPKLGPLNAGDPIGSGEYLQFAALRKQPDGSWTMVEPSQEILERSLSSPASEVN
ncbi:MAG: hypothetical protein ACO3EZ_03790 [Prochlorotrichaceae cyanobacterium]